MGLWCGSVRSRRMAGDYPYSANVQTVIDADTACSWWSA
jgi:hypothetical protein